MQCKEGLFSKNVIVERNKLGVTPGRSIFFRESASRMLLVEDSAGKESNNGHVSNIEGKFHR